MDPFAAAALPQVTHIDIDEAGHPGIITAVLPARYVAAVVEHFGQLIADGQPSDEVQELYICFSGALTTFSTGEETS